MPKIILRNTQTGEDEQFEPVDAREILSNPDAIYEIPQATRDAIGQQHDVFADINVPQLQGNDSELQTGLSIDKYGRGAVVKANPENPTLSDPFKRPAVPEEIRPSEQDVRPKKEEHKKGK